MSEYLTEEEQLARMRSWWDRYGTAVVLTLVAAVAILGGWQWYEGHQRDQALEAARVYDRYLEAAETDKAAIAAQLATDHAGSGYHVFVLFDQAQRALDEGDVDSARLQLQQAVDQADDDLLADLARIRLAKVLQELDLSAEALAMLDSLRNAGYRSWALEAKGDIFMAQNQIEAAHEAYQAAADALMEGDTRPVLQMKLNNTVPFDGQFVVLEDDLQSALREAERTLTQSPAVDPAATAAQDAGPDAGIDSDAAVESDGADE